jgi:hypothetical protein
MNPQETAWLGGIIDSEGSIFQRKRSSGALGNPVLEIYNVNKQFLEKVALVIGTDATVYSYIGNGIKRRPMHSVRLDRRRTMFPLLEQVLPWLIVKRTNAERALTWYREHEHYRHTNLNGAE